VNGNVISALRVCLVALGLGALFGQTVYVPVAASQSAQVYPELAYLAVPYALATIVVLLCVQAAVVAVWKLLAMVRAAMDLRPAGSAVGGSDHRRCRGGDRDHGGVGHAPDQLGRRRRPVRRRGAGLLPRRRCGLRAADAGDAWLLRSATVLQTEMAEVV